MSDLFYVPVHQNPYWMAILRHYHTLKLSKFKKFRHEHSAQRSTKHVLWPRDHSIMVQQSVRDSSTLIELFQECSISTTSKSDRPRLKRRDIRANYFASIDFKQFVAKIG